MAAAMITADTRTRSQTLSRMRPGAVSSEVGLDGVVIKRTGLPNDKSTDERHPDTVRFPN
jgi:hypothetical protein